MTRSSQVLYEALVKIFLFNAVILSVGNTILYTNDPIIIIYNQCYCWHENRGYHASSSL